MEAIRIEAKKYLPDDFDPDKELEEARADRYSVVDFGKEDGRNGYDQP